MQKKYRALGHIGFLLKIIGVCELVVGLVSVIILPLLLSDSDIVLQPFGVNPLFPGAELLTGIFAGLVVFFCGLVFGLLTFSAGEIFNLLIAIEENTRLSFNIIQDREENLQ